MSTDKFAAEERTEPEAQVEITGRNVEVPEHFADRVKGKLAKIERLDPTLTYFHVELKHEPNPRRSDESDRIQITATGKGTSLVPRRRKILSTQRWKLRSVAWSALRKVKARRKIAMTGHRAPKGMGEATAALVEEAKPDQVEEKPGKYDVDPYEDQFKPGQVVRKKVHKAEPMTVDDALSEMELVGHDFFLFINEETKQPSVVYRRHAYDYGLISLETKQA